MSADPANNPERLHDKPTGLISISDIGVVIGLPILTTISWLVPASCWPGVCRFISGLAMAFQPDRWGERAKIIENWAHGAESDEKPSARALARAAMAVEIERSLLMLRLHRPFKRWCDVTLVGAEHIDAALAKGKGAIIWDSHFALATTGTKIALSRSGYGLHHLSNIYHGYSSTSFGIRALNPIWVAAEMKAIAERVVVAYVNPRPALDALRARLEENSIVSIVVRSEASGSLRLRSLMSPWHWPPAHLSWPQKPLHNCCPYLPFAIKVERSSRQSKPLSTSLAMKRTDLLYRQRWMPTPKGWSPGCGSIQTSGYPGAN